MVYVHTLRFTNGNELSWAFYCLASSPFVEDCLTEPDMLRIRFVAELEHAAMLIESKR